jgi:hypothetical protein
MPATPFVSDDIGSFPVEAILSALAGASSATSGITAHAGGTQAAAVPLANTFNQIDVCATTGDSVALPAAIAGAWLVLVNNGAASAQVFGVNGGTDTINGAAGSTGVAHANGKAALYFCAKTGAWFRLLSA